MRHIAPVWAILGASIALAAEPKDPMTLAVPAERTEAASKLVAKLDDDDILVRDKATRELAAMGRDALPALLAAQEGKPTDRIRDRLAELLPAARTADFDARAALFLADKDAKFDHTLPGWDDLKAAVKDTKESRLLFADILADESGRAMLTAAFDPTADGRKAFEKRWEGKLAEWRAARLPAAPAADEPIHWMAAALLADLVYARDYLSHFRAPVVAMYAKTDEGKAVIGGKGRHGAAVREFVRYWIDQQADPLGMIDGERFARAFKFDDEYLRTCLERQLERNTKDGVVNGSFPRLAATRSTSPPSASCSTRPRGT